MTDNPENRSPRRSFWTGLILGIFLGAGLFILLGNLLWDPIKF